MREWFCVGVKSSPALASGRQGKWEPRVFDPLPEPGFLVRVAKFMERVAWTMTARYPPPHFFLF
jgi:hypothetical protein